MEQIETANQIQLELIDEKTHDKQRFDALISEQREKTDRLETELKRVKDEQL
jgi:hypothetical protein